MRTRSWQDQSGAKKYRTEIIGENIQMGPRSGNTGSYTPPAGGSAEPVQKEEIPIIEEPVAKKNNDEVNVDDIPF